ncbi:MAG TPA: glycoside hydrolase family 43 protein [Acidobacteriaceae bacterium]|nr:glycoside hydrolase family 43 protein [Acidobacteriaceae bacterium]
MKFRFLFLLLLFACAFAVAKPAAASAPSNTFTNPLLPSGPDPSVTFRGGFYYYMNTTGNNLTIWKTRDITDLKHAEKKVVWTPPATGPDSKDIWAPELHFLRGKWYIYFAADDGVEENHHLWVVENSSPDPLAGSWKMKGKLPDTIDTWAIDPTVFENRGIAYVLWAGWKSHVDQGVTNIYISRLKNPWTMEGPRVRLSTPQYPWEKVGDRKDRPYIMAVPHVDVNEGPEILQHGDKIFLVYSASGCWTDYYELGMLTASASSNLLDPASWKKSSKPVFWQSAAASAFGPGHNTFFKSPDGTQDWIMFHANPKPNQGCGGNRQPRAQPIHWNADGMPDFGRPIPLNQPIPKPSGTK